MGKYITTMCLIIGGIVPIIADTSSSHLFNPDWDAHARVHEAWRLSTNFLIFSLGIYLLWVKKNEVLSALLSLCIHLGFVFAAVTMSSYGGVAVGAGMLEPSVIGIPFNIFIFSSMFVIQSAVLIFTVVKHSITVE